MIEGDITLICWYMVCSKRRILTLGLGILPAGIRLYWVNGMEIFKEDNTLWLKVIKKQVWHMQEETGLSPECYGH